MPSPSALSSGLVPGLLLLMTATAFATTVDETRNVNGFKGVSIGGGIVARVETGPELVVLRGDEADLRLIRTEIRDGILQIGWLPDVERPSDRPISALVRLPRAEHIGSSGGSRVESAVAVGDEVELHASGGSELTVKNKLAPREIEIHVSGSARMLVPGIESREAEVHISGAARLTLAGRAGQLELHASGGSELAGESFATAGLEVNASGGAVAKLRVDGPVQGSLSGGARVHAPGATSVRVSTSGGAAVIR